LVCLYTIGGNALTVPHLRRSMQMKPAMGR
jgi:hypothetical protein